MIEKGEYLTCAVGSYELSVELCNGQLTFQASSKLTDKIFEGGLLAEGLPLCFRNLQGGCTAVFRLVEEALSSNEVKLSEKQLKFKLKVRQATARVVLTIGMTQVAGEVENTSTGIEKISNHEREQIENLRKELCDQRQMTEELRESLKEQMACTERAKHLVKIDRRIMHQKVEREDELLTLSKETTQTLDIFKRFNFESFREVSQLQPDINSPYFKHLSVEGRTLMAKPGLNNFFPIFLSKTPFADKQFFEVQVSSVGNREVMIGVNTFNNRNRKASYSKQGSMYFYAAGKSSAYVDGIACNILKLVLEDGDRLQVRVDLQSHTVEWLRVRPLETSIGSIIIPQGIKGKDLYPSIEFSSNFTGSVSLL